MTDSKHIVQLRLEQSKVLEKLEELRQLVLTSTLVPDRTLKLNNTLDSFQYKVYEYYEEKAEIQQKVGNI